MVSLRSADTAARCPAAKAMSELDCSGRDGRTDVLRSDRADRAATPRPSVRVREAATMRTRATDAHSTSAPEYSAERDFTKERITLLTSRMFSFSRAAAALRQRVSCDKPPYELIDKMSYVEGSVHAASQQ